MGDAAGVDLVTAQDVQDVRRCCGRPVEAQRRHALSQVSDGGFEPGEILVVEHRRAAMISWG